MAILLNVNAEEAGQKLLNFLQRCLVNEKVELHRWIRTGQVRINSARAKAFDRVEMGDSVRVPPFAEQKNIPPSAVESHHDVFAENNSEFKRKSEVKNPRGKENQENATNNTKENPQKDRGQSTKESTEKLSARMSSNTLEYTQYGQRKSIEKIYEDEDILVINKPFNLPCQGGTGHEVHLVQILREHYGHMRFIPAPAHRLDKQSTGIVLIGKSYRGLRFLSDFMQQENRPFQKEAQGTESLKENIFTETTLPETVLLKEILPEEVLPEEKLLEERLPKESFTKKNAHVLAEEKFFKNPIQAHKEYLLWVCGKSHMLNPQEQRHNSTSCKASPQTSQQISSQDSSQVSNSALPYKLDYGLNSSLDSALPCPNSSFYMVHYLYQDEEQGRMQALSLEDVARMKVCSCACTPNKSKDLDNPNKLNNINNLGRLGKQDTPEGISFIANIYEKMCDVRSFPFLSPRYRNQGKQERDGESILNSRNSPRSDESNMIRPRRDKPNLNSLSQDKSTLNHYASAEQDFPRINELISFNEENAHLISELPVSVFLEKLGLRVQVAISVLECLKVQGEYSLFKVGIFTGRKHQIRVQCAHLGFCLVGDGKYGIKSNETLKLHAYRVNFPVFQKEELLNTNFAKWKELCSLPEWDGKFSVKNI